MDNPELTDEEKIQMAKLLEAKVEESKLNRFCRENKDLLNVGSRIGIYLGIMLILVVATKYAVMQQVEWAESNCPCMNWGGDIFTLTQTPKETGNTIWSYGGYDGRTTTGG